MATFHKEKRSSFLPSKKITIRQSVCNFRSFLLRLLLTSILLFLFLWVLIQLHSFFLSSLRLHSRPLSSSPSWANFTIAFSNVQREYSLQRPPPDDDPCQGKPIKLLVLIMSRRETAEKRRGIRGSWAKDVPDGIIVRFVIGGPTPDEKNQTGVKLELEREQRKFGDMIRYTIPDGYANLHFKMSAAFQWQLAFCPNAQFVMKTDDDTVVDLGRWWHWTEHKFMKDLERNRAAYFGYVLANTAPIRQKDNHWYVPLEHFPGNRYPNYMQGATYFGTAEAIQAVMAHTREVIGFNMDDIIFTGTLAEKANVSRIDYKVKHFRGGDPFFPDEPCEQGVPTLFAIFRGFTRAEEYKKEYTKLHSLKCKLQSPAPPNMPP